MPTTLTILLKNSFRNNLIVVFSFLILMLMQKAMLWLTPAIVLEKLTPYWHAFNDKGVAWRNQFSPPVQRFGVNFSLGLIIIFMVYTFDDLKPVREFEDWGADLFINMMVNTAPDKNIVPYAFLDMNDRTFNAWHEPFFTPRNKLLTLIKTATEAKAKVVIVDIDLHRKGDQYFDALIAYFAAYDQQCVQATKNNQRPCPSIILMRSFDTDKENKRIPSIKAAPPALEKAVLQSANIHWASSLYDLSKDQLVRYWNLWQPVCSLGKEKETTTVIPSAQLLAFVLATSNDPSKAYHKLMLRLDLLKPTSCDRALINTEEKQHVAPLNVGSVQIDFSQTHVSKRIFYTIPWHNRNSTAHTPDGQILLQTIPAYLISDNDGVKSFKAIENRITIIGASYKESGDIHTTPLADMPGSMVIVNSIHSLQQFGNLASTYSLVVVCIIQILLIAAISALYAWHAIDSSWVGGISLLLIIILLPVSMMFIGYGIWLNFALPLFVVQVFQVVLEFYEQHIFKEHPLPNNFARR